MKKLFLLLSVLFLTPFYSTRANNNLTEHQLTSKYQKLVEEANEAIVFGKVAAGSQDTHIKEQAAQAIEKSLTDHRIFMKAYLENQDKIGKAAEFEMMNNLQRKVAAQLKQMDDTLQTIYNELNHYKEVLNEHRPAGPR